LSFKEKLQNNGNVVNANVRKVVSHRRSID